MGTQIEAVVLDYGNVMSLRQREEHIDRIRVDLGCDISRFREIYSRERRRLDAGELTMPEYWKETLTTFGYEVSGRRAERFAELDLLSWSAVNPRMVSWVERLPSHGLRPFLLTNMPSDFFDRVVASSSWYPLFEGGVISGKIGMVKPDREIYEHVLSLTGTPPEKILFLDDSAKNIEGAKAVGIEAVVFESLEKTGPALVGRYGVPAIDGVGAGR